MDMLCYYIFIMSIPENHAHLHHGHAGHTHTHPGDTSGRIALDPAWSLLRLSAAGRLVLAGALLAVLWLAVFVVMN